MKTLKLKNYFLIGNERVGLVSLQGWLFGLMLHGEDSRNRTRFIKLLEERMKEINEEMEKMKVKFCDKDENGNIIYLDSENKESTTKGPNSRFKISDENSVKLELELNEYMSKELVIDVMPSNKDSVYGVRDIIFNTKIEFSGIMSVRYDEWCSAFENIKKEEE